jgi:hypothetical protein
LLGFTSLMSLEVKVFLAVAALSIRTLEVPIFAVLSNRCFVHSNLMEGYFQPMNSSSSSLCKRFSHLLKVLESGSAGTF